MVVGLQDLHLHWYGLEHGSGPPTPLLTSAPSGEAIGGDDNGHGYHQCFLAAVWLAAQFRVSPGHMVQMYHMPGALQVETHLCHHVRAHAGERNTR